jgi:predicted ATPase/transcriptional regulator with XRE-family HTH domain
MATDPRADPPPFGRLLRRLRVAAGLTQEALAERAGLSARGLSDLERGIHAAPRQDTLDLLVTALSVGPDDRAALVAAARRSAAVTSRPRVSSPGSEPIRAMRFPGAALPVPLDALIGREREVAAVVSLFHDPSVRLVTLTGPGGVGKTRLALQVAANLQRAFPGGVGFVPLAAIREATLVLPAIAQALGVRETPHRPTEEALAVALLGQSVLLVLDNLEQVLDAAPAVARLLAAVPALRLLVTSRVALRLTGEQRYLVPPLATADPASDDRAETLPNDPAFRLFVRRARQVRADFALTPAAAAATTAICARLDGLPLAIELASARVTVLPPTTLLARLERALPVLTGGARDQPERLQTMRDAIAWSYDLLPAGAQSVFRQVAVFEGGFTLEAATAVGNDDDTPEDEFFDVIAGLVEANLVRAEDGLAGEPRFSLLETIREYGVDLLAASGQEALTRKRHTAWIVDLAEQAEPQLFRADQQTWWNRLEAERPNIRAALRWCEHSGDAERAQRLAGALWTFAWLRGHMREGQDWLQRALAIPGVTSGAVRAWALVGLEAMAWNRSDFASAWTLGEAALAASREATFPLGVAVSLALLAGTAWMQGELERALVIIKEAVAHLREAGHPGWLGVFLVDMGTLQVLNGDEERGLAWSAEGLALNRALGNRWVIANHLGDLGVVAHGRGDLEEAARHYAESARLLCAVGDTWYIAGPLAGLAGLAVWQGRAETAARLLGVAAALREASGTTAWTTEQGRDEQSVSAARKALGEERYVQALADGRALPLQQAVAEALVIADTVAGTEEPSPA